MREDGPKGKKEGLPERNIEDLERKLRLEVSLFRRAMKYCQGERMLEDRGALPKDCNQLREYEALHEENFLSNWLREDVEGVTADMERLKEEAEQKENKKWERRCGERREKG